MRLLHTTNLELVSFIGTPVQERPRYAILSHTWKDDEFLFEEARNGIPQHLQNPRTGLRKILNACEKARENKLDYIWVDTCCIDKSSSSELSEAINSMFKWYKESTDCYVFMDDVWLQTDGTMRNFEESRWFTRGWTLQELIAPHGLRFFDADWKYMCRRDQVASRLEEITGIPGSILQRAHIFPPRETIWRSHFDQLCWGCGYNDEVKRELAEESISRKMRWAAYRQTTRPEDTSYCLLGLFDINMPLLYGEGEKAFCRLQEEILKQSPDQSILTWTEHTSSGGVNKPYLAEWPSKFQFEVQRPGNTLLERGDIITTARGLEIDILLGPCSIHDKESKSPIGKREQFMAILSCAVASDPLARVAIFVEPLTARDPNTAYSRVSTHLLVLLHPSAEPLVMATDFESRGAREFKNIVVEYDPRKLSASRILLAAIRLARDPFKQRTRVNIVAPGIENVNIEAIQSPLTDGTWMSYKPSSSQGETVGTLSVGGAWYLGNGHSGFFVLWGRHGSPADGDVVSWAETWESFMQRERLRASPSTLQLLDLTTALRLYIRDHKGVLSTCISEPGFKVKVKVKMTEFLGRTAYRVVLDIDGWEGCPLSTMYSLEVIADAWS